MKALPSGGIQRSNSTWPAVMAMNHNGNHSRSQRKARRQPRRRFVPDPAI